MDEEDWDLHALVRSFSTDKTTAAADADADATITAVINNNNTTTTYEDPFANHCPTPFVNHHEDPFWFPNLFQPQNTNPFAELEQIYQPFYPTTTTTTTTLPPHLTPPPPPPSTTISNLSGFTIPNPPIHLQNQHQFHQKPIATTTTPPAITPTFGPRSRRRKNQQKRVVQQVTAESLSADVWAWRKYGQKPIKGSPHPRNYYRCSSTKGCMARKQVERSHTDSSMFIITYTGEHSHPRPTHRNSLAGSTRNKYTSITAAAIAVVSTAVDNTVSTEPITNSPSPTLSPTTPLITPLMEEKINGGDDYEDMMDDEEFDGEDLLIPNMAMMNEDIFMGFQELGQEVPASISHRRH